ncbi:hypothetical protein PG996_005780 [Apiospora saccharicola]|uniref:HRDC domain-containing protein n=1 Tax=Apiospora saccharicola TaxID=335842 RepID=A0ABR1VMQ1_9PEZI
MSSSQSQQGPAGGPNPTSPSIPANHKPPAEKPAWPLSYRLKAPIPKAAPSSNNGNAQGHNPALIYCTTKEQSQKAAEFFLSLPVVGFDMEWPWDAHKRTGLKNKIALIQLASEGRIALFHIALHQGSTVDDLIAPALRAVLESPSISKVGVGVMNADFARLIQFFKLDPKGAFELSHLHNLVQYGDEEYDMITTKLVGLARQVEEHLGLPFWKGKTRTSDWSKPLNRDQLTYAADDAYAGFMLYHRMNAKRLAMAIVPTLPVHVDQYPGVQDRLSGMMSNRSVWLRPERPGAGIYTAPDFFRKSKGIPIEKRDENKANRGEKRKEPEEDAASPDKKKSSPKVPKLEETALSDDVKAELFELLKAQRTRTAQAEKVPAYCVATNAELETLAARRPTNKQQLLKIKGTGPRKVEKYGEIWLGIIRTLVREKRVPLAEQEQPVTPKANVIKRVGQSLEFKGSPPTLQTNTGLSFSMEDASITVNKNKQAREDSSSDESEFGSPIPSPSRENVERRRYDALPPQRNPFEGRPSPGKPWERDNVAMPPLEAAPAAPLAPALTPSRAQPDMTPSLSKDAMIFEKKLTALSRMVVSKLPPAQRSPAGPPLILDATIRQLALNPPGTAQELLHIQGIAPFVRACANAKIDLMGNIAKWRPAAEASPT